MSGFNDVGLSFFTECGNMKNKINGASLVLYYHPDCKYCVNFKGEFAKIKESMPGKVFSLNMKNYKIPSKFNYIIAGYPTIIIFANGNACTIYTGARIAKDILSFMNDLSDTKACKISGCSE